MKESLADHTNLFKVSLKNEKYCDVYKNWKKRKGYDIMIIMKGIRLDNQQHLYIDS